jgi:hypothetical protein
MINPISNYINNYIINLNKKLLPIVVTLEGMVNVLKDVFPPFISNV